MTIAQQPSGAGLAGVRGDGLDQAQWLDDALGNTADLGQRISLLADAIEGRVTFSTSLGLEDQAILHAIAETGAAIDVFTLDTGRHFPETLETWAATELHYGLKIRALAPLAEDIEMLVARDGVLGFRSSIEARKACCHARKVLPLERGLAGAKGWITGMRRGQSSGRADVPFATWDADHRLIKFNPIADWPLERLEQFATDNATPINPLHARGFPSIGCQPCTRAIRPGEDIRAGRWWWENEDGKECGLHNRPKHKETAE